ncbi:MAG: ATP-binding protein [Patescibacteria group bacterium]|nr:ATP-binding protein [Patescibacteria group bacterium]
MVVATNFGIAIFFLFSARKHYLFALFTMSAGVWGVGAYIFSSASMQGYDLAFLGWKIAYMGAFFTVIFFSHFVMKYLDMGRKKLILYLYISGLIFSFFNWYQNSHYFLQDLRFVFNEIYWLDAIKANNFLWYIFYVSYYWVALLYVFYKLIVKYCDSEGAYKQKIKYFIIAAGIGWLGTEPLFLPALHVDAYPYSNFLIAIYPLIFAYAIVRHQVMDVEIIIKKTLIYSALITVITLLYFLIVYAMERIFSVYIGYHSPFLSILIISFIILIFTPLKNRLQHIVDKYFFKGSIDQIDAEKRLLESELERTERLKSIATLASGMAHEIKNPLTSIKTFSEFVKTRGMEHDFREKFEKIVPQEIDKITNIVNQLLDYSKTDRTRLAECNIHDILDYVLELHNNELIRRNIRLEKAYAAQNPNITCDPNKLKQAFINLVLNAIEAMGENGVLTVGTEGADHLVVMVKDTGPGISPANIPHLFDPFFTTKDSGTGLGLFVTHQIIAANAGKISVVSEKGKGTEFKVEFDL